MDIEKSELMNEHTIKSNQVLCCSETGRVIAVFYHDCDLNGLMEKMKGDEKEIEQLKRMIDNGIGWADLEDDSKPF